MKTSAGAKKILVVAHNTFFGASQVLLDTCQVLVKKGWNLRFIVLDGGPLFAEFQALGDVQKISWQWPLKVGGFRSFIRNLKVMRKAAMIIYKIRKWNPDAIYVNTTFSGPFLRLLEKLDKPIMMHVHELESTNAYAFNHLFPVEDFLKIPTCYIAVSQAVRNHLRHDHKIPDSKITLAYEGVNTERIDNLASVPAPNVAIKNGKTYIIGASGYSEWRKGTDLWLQLARNVKNRNYPAEIKFVWCGPIPDKNSRNWDLRNLAWDIQKLGLSEDVSFTGYLDNPFPVYSQFDIFSLTSREDACPLVCLENMYLGKPIVYFTGSGGIGEVIRNDAGIGVENFDVGKMAEEVLKLIENKELGRRMGQIGRKRIVEQFSIQRLADDVGAVFERATLRPTGRL